MPRDEFLESLSLNKFKEKIKPEGYGSLSTEAYRMDGKEDPIPSMSRLAELGVSICDYLYIDKNRAILIEDTRLGQQVRRLYDFDKENPEKESFKKLLLETNLQQTFEKFWSSHEIKHKADSLKTMLLEENQLKVYGALLVLCRLEKKYEKISQELHDKEFAFWLVINDEEDIKAIDDLISDLKKELKRSLKDKLEGSKLMRDVEILPLSEFKKKLSTN